MIFLKSITMSFGAIQYDSLNVDCTSLYESIEVAAWLLKDSARRNPGVVVLVVKQNFLPYLAIDQEESCTTEARFKLIDKF